MTYEEYLKDNEEFAERLKNDNYIVERNWCLNLLSRTIAYVRMQPPTNYSKIVLDDLKELKRYIRSKEEF